MEYKDYYKVLGVEKSATVEQIKKAYKKLAIKYHPDKNPGDKAAEARFKEINEANQILGNPEKRQKYDDMGENWDQFQPGARSRGGNTNVYGEGFDPSSFAGSGQFSDFFEAFFGAGAGGFNTSTGRRAGGGKRKGGDLLGEIEIGLRDAFFGSSYPVSLDGTSLNLKLKPGLAEGQRLRLKGKGEQGVNGGENGDLIITVHINKDPVFERKGNDLHFDQPLNLYTAVLGGKVEVQGIDKTVRVDIPAGIEANKTIRLKGMGMPLYNKPEERGNAYVRLVTQLPKHLTEKERALFNELSELRA